MRSWWFWFGCLMMLQSYLKAWCGWRRCCWDGALTWLARRCWYWYLSIGLHQWPPNMDTSFPQSESFKQTHRGRCNVFHDLALEVTHISTISCWLHRPALPTVGVDDTGHGSREVGTTGIFLEVDTIPASSPWAVLSWPCSTSMQAISFHLGF